MADFVAVLKKTLDGLGDNSPEMRARVYDKARATISAKLAAITPPPAPIVIERQKAALEQAIKTVEAEYAAPPPSPVDDLDEVMNTLEATVKVAPPPPSRPQPDAPVVSREPPKASPPVAASAPDAEDEIAPASPSRAEDRLASESLAGMPPRKASRGRLGLAVAGLIVLVFAGAAGYAVWLNRTEVSQMLGLGTPASQPAPQGEASAPATSATPEPAQDVAKAEPEAPAPAVEQPAVQKFTQKLNADGTETDQGPAGGAPGVGEGTSVAALTVQPPAAAPATPPAADQTPAAPETPAGAETAQATPPAAEAPPAEQPAAVPVGQRAIFYEERTSASGGSAEAGNTVWSLVQESPGDGLPAEPAIRADATIPGKDIQLRLTIRRNGDKTLPASHIVELIFLTPDNFEGGTIDNLLRMTMKETEEATGNPLLGVPAKIGDGFFLIALSDGKAENDANMQLFRRMKWVDIPIVYRSGRRALMTLERGVPGDKVFEEALKAWSQPNG
ncbi:hypothetical protein [Mesorhizobium australicum]|uniref:CheA signal transduction histidine kinase n=1 Tax=Mesorhizobium australicum TaxID=536018 RepID=A0A1X7PVP4_9HYPH|nr:hypothetical protein [Mesorhizobium australicum]SMH55387.1 hypothetical protein SAMN02982922_5342 [Mesorhizobium australicum]